MKLTTAYRILRTQAPRTITTKDAASWFQVHPNTASQMLRRLQEDQLLVHLKNGLWCFHDMKQPFALPEALTFPMPSYISFLSALYQHEMISQIPTRIFAATLARSRTYNTPWGIVSLHHLSPILFDEYERDTSGAFFIATPEKALFDTLYMARSKVRWFAKLPEIEIPKSFRKSSMLRLISRVSDSKRKTEILRDYKIIMKNVGLLL